MGHKYLKFRPETEGVKLDRPPPEEVRPVSGSKDVFMRFWRSSKPPPRNSAFARAHPLLTRSLADKGLSNPVGTCEEKQNFDSQAMEEHDDERIFLPRPLRVVILQFALAAQETVILMRIQDALGRMLRESEHLPGWTEYQGLFGYDEGIMTIAQQQMLLNWLPSKFWALIYRGSEHGWCANDFHRICDGKGPSVVVIRTDCGNILGGYASKSWTSNPASDERLFETKWKAPGCFLFLLHSVCGKATGK